MRLIQVAEYKLWIVVSCKFVRKARRSTRLIISKFLADGSWLIADSRQVPGSSLVIFTSYPIPQFPPILFIYPLITFSLQPLKRPRCTTNVLSSG